MANVDVSESDVFELDDLAMDFRVEESQMLKHSNPESVVGIVPHGFQSLVLPLSCKEKSAPTLEWDMRMKLALREV